MSTKKKTYISYSALITQAGGAAPTAKILSSELGGALIFSRTGAGNYLATLVGAFDINKTQIFFGGNSGSYSNFYTAGFNDADSIYLGTSVQTGFGAFTPTDGLLFELPIEIRIYE